MAEREFAIRLSAKGMDQVRSALKGMGGDGAQALRQIDAASQKASPGLKAVDNAARGVRDSFEGMAGRIPVIGGALSALGPVGLAAAAGIAGLGAGLASINGAARQAIEDIGAIKDSADNLQVSVEDLQALYGQGLLKGIDNRAMEMMLQALGINAARASEGFGKMKSALDKVDPALGAALAATTTQAQRLDILAKALQQATTENEKLNIVTAAFGKEGAKMIRVLDEGGASMATWRAEAEAAGLVLSEELVNSVEELGDRLGVMDAKIKVSQSKMAIAFSPMVEWFKQIETGAYDTVAAVSESMKALEDQADWFIQKRLADAKRGAENVGYSRSGIGEAGANVQAGRVAAMEMELRSRAFAAAQTAQRAEMAKSYNDMIAEGEAFAEWLQKWSVRNAKEDRAEARKAAEDRQREATRRQAEADREAEAAKRVREATEERYLALIESAHPITVQLTNKIQQLHEEFAAGNVTMQTYQGSLSVFIGELTEAEKQIADAITDAGKLLARQGDGVKKLKDDTKEATEASFELRFAAETIGGVFDQQIESLEDLGAVAMRVFRQMAIEAILAQSKIKGAGLMDLISAGFSAIFGGAPASAPASVSHTGGVVGDPTMMTRAMPLQSFFTAPRFHSGFAPDEFPTVLQRGERVFSARHNERLVRAIESGSGGGAANVSIRIIDETGAKFETRETMGPDGGREVEIRVRQAAAAGAAQGDLDGVMSQRYGISRKTR